MLADNVMSPGDVCLLRESAHEFARDFIRSSSAEADRSGRISQKVLDHPWSDILSSAYVPLKYGGGVRIPGSDRKTECHAQLSIALTEELSWGDPGITCGLPGPSLAFPVLLKFGNEAQKEKYLGMFCKRRNVWAAFATTESGAGTDTGAMKTNARKVSGGYILNGSKCFITNGARASYVIIFATVDSSLRQFGQRAFIVETDSNGFSVGRTEDMMGLRAAAISEIVMDDCFVPEENLLVGSCGRAYLAGTQGAAAAWNFFRVEVSAISVGIARAIYDALDNLYGVNLSNLKTDIDAGRILCLNAAIKYDLGQDNSYNASLAKAYTADLAMRTCRVGIKIAGPEALEEGHLFERMYRAAKVFNILEGTGEIQREHICSHMPFR